jgi:hypothetical protein
MAFDLCVRRAGGPAISSWLGSCSGVGGLVEGRKLIAPRFPLPRPGGRLGLRMPSWTGRFDNALHLSIMRDLKRSGRKFLVFASCNFGPSLFVKAK